MWCAQWTQTRLGIAVTVGCAVWLACFGFVDHSTYLWSPPRIPIPSSGYTQSTPPPPVSLFLLCSQRSRIWLAGDQYLASHAWNRQMFGVSFSETKDFSWVKGINALFSVCPCSSSSCRCWHALLVYLASPEDANVPPLSCLHTLMLGSRDQCSVEEWRWLCVKQQSPDWQLIYSFVNGIRCPVR